MASLLITNGTVIDPSQQIEQTLDVLIEDGRITRLAPQLAAGSRADTTIDAKGKIVAPGLIDIHVHFREPGDEEEETIASGSACAVVGILRMRLATS